MAGKKLAKFLLFVMAFELLLFSAAEAKAKAWWWGSRRRRCSSSKPAGVAWVNNWQQYFTFSCQNNFSLKQWRSQHRNCKEDRIHYFQCAYGPVNYHSGNCDWTNHYVNDFDKPVNFKCHHNGFITGVRSDYSGGHRDRRFGFRCCHVAGYKQHNCQITPYQNHWDREVRYTVPAGHYLTGVFSYHSNRHEDRRWRFEICRITK